MAVHFSLFAKHNSIPQQYILYILIFCMSTKTKTMFLHFLYEYRVQLYNGVWIMFEGMFKERLTQLRLQKDVSARDMSLSLGQSESYINKIETKNTLPSMTVFFYICDYFGITPSEFFDTSIEAPNNLKETIELLKTLNSEQLEHINAIIRDIKK